jgi:predicted transcriptional regulator
MSPPVALTLDDRALARALYEREGLSLKKVGQALGCTHHVVSRIASEDGWNIRAPVQKKRGLKKPPPKMEDSLALARAAIERRLRKLILTAEDGLTEGDDKSIRALASVARALKDLHALGLKENTAAPDEAARARTSLDDDSPAPDPEIWRASLAQRLEALFRERPAFNGPEHALTQRS